MLAQGKDRLYYWLAGWKKEEGEGLEGGGVKMQKRVWGGRTAAAAAVAAGVVVEATAKESLVEWLSWEKQLMLLLQEKCVPVGG